MRLALTAVAVTFSILSHADAQVNHATLNLEWRSIGPAATGGRIADLAVVKSPGQADIIYVATTTGGVFKSVNAGISFAPIFDHAGAMMSTGAVAVAPSNPTIVWVGTGEADNRQSSSWGDGVYKSLDSRRDVAENGPGGHAPHRQDRHPSRAIQTLSMSPR